MIKEQVNLKNILVDLRRILEGGYICSVRFLYCIVLSLFRFCYYNVILNEVKNCKPSP